MVHIPQTLFSRFPGLKWLVLAMVIVVAAWASGLYLYAKHIKSVEKEQWANYVKKKGEKGLEAEEGEALSNAHLSQEAHRQMAEYLMEKKQYSAAIPHFEQVVNPEDQVFLQSHWDFALQLADAYLQDRRSEKALTFLRKVALFFPEDPGVLRRMGTACFYAGDGEMAADYLRRAFDKDSTDAESLVLLAKLYYQSDHTRTDVPLLFEKAIRLDSNSVSAHYAYGTYLSDRGDYAGAVNQFEAVLKVEPFHSPSVARLGMVHYYLNDIPKAKELYALALSINPTDYNTEYNLGELFLNSLQDPLNALEHFRKTVELNPNHFFATKKLGILSLNNRNYKEACVYLERAYVLRKEGKPFISHNMAFDNELVDVLIMHATALEALGRKAEAIEKLRSALKENPLDRIARHKLSLLLQAG
ncbi:MAG: hypothetical protein A2293_16130 [Elusimicrobia bacterium RIFOXYB2_FULL_49_7]|nr:MAG: hypothetical protein A2293_16130 [Elusimicrobia bacterium RIFOXYB2_FULL_49_7]